MTDKLFVSLMLGVVTTTGLYVLGAAVYYKPELVMFITPCLIFTYLFYTEKL